MDKNIDYTSDKFILCAGSALVPQGTALYEALKVVSCILVIDTEEERIVKCAFTTVNSLTNEFFSSILVGYDLSQGMEKAIAKLRDRTFLLGQKAFIKSLQTAYQRYQDFKQKNFT